MCYVFNQNADEVDFGESDVNPVKFSDDFSTYTNELIGGSEQEIFPEDGFENCFDFVPLDGEWSIIV